MLLVCQISTAQFYEVSRYADDSGLPSRIVRDIDQDPKGYIWVAGNNGLYQFDGHKFRAHYSKLKDSTGLRDNKINTVLAASDGKIWIATPKGLHTLENEEINYIPLKNKPNDKQNHIIELFEDSKQNIWVGTYGGLYVIEKNTNRIVNISEENELLDENTAIKGVTEDFNGNIWVCRALQVPIMAKKDTYSFQSFSITYENQLSEKEIQSFKYIPFNEQLFLIVSNLGILKATLDEDKNLTIDRFHDLNNNEIATDYAYNAIIDSEQNIWVATWRNQFKKYKVIDENLEEIEVISKNGFLNMSEQARSIFEDS